MQENKTTRIILTTVLRVRLLKICCFNNFQKIEHEMIQENIKEEIKNRLKLSDIVSKKISLKKKGENRFLALCPFHNEKTPSFNVQDEKGFFHCFGCGKHGDIFNFVMEIDNLDFKEEYEVLSVEQK